MDYKDTLRSSSNQGAELLKHFTNRRQRLEQPAARSYKCSICDYVKKPIEQELEYLQLQLGF